MTKVCHLTSVHSIDDIRIFIKECISLAASDFDVTLIACGDKSFNDVSNGVKRIQLAVPERSRINRFLKQPKIIYKKALEVNAEIFHFHDPELLPVGLKLKKKGKKVIFDSHEFYGEQIREKHYIPLPFRNFISILYLRYEAYVCKKIDAVIQVCTLNSENYFDGRAKKVVYIRNTPRLQNYNRNKAIIFSERKHITHVGSLTYNRGTTHLIKASYHANVPLLLGGAYKPEKYRKKVENLKEYSIVDYKGFVKREEMMIMLNKSFAGLSTLLNISQYDKIDTFPTKVYDYMSAGIPVIISATKYSKHMIKKYNIGICVEPNNIEDISNAIKYLRENPKIAEQMGENGRKALEEEFNWNIEERKLINLYIEL